MAWQILAMWSIVIVTITWFVRDEKRQRRDNELAEAARYYAHAPKYRHVTAEPAVVEAAPVRRVGGLSAAQREYMQSLLRRN